MMDPRTRACEFCLANGCPDPELCAAFGHPECPISFPDQPAYGRAPDMEAVKEQTDNERLAGLVRSTRCP